MNFSPKANLRHAGSYSTKDEFTKGGFKEVLDDSTITDASLVKKVLFCSGKIYFDLAERQQKENRNDVAIIRLEQIHPLPQKQLDELYKKYSPPIVNHIGEIAKEVGGHGGVDFIMDWG